MPEESLCTIYSYYKACCGTGGEGNLLKAFPNKHLCFDGAGENCYTIFSRENKMVNCTLYITFDGKKYGICETNKTISLKENCACVFTITKCPGIEDDFIKVIRSKLSGLYLTSDGKGRPVMSPWEDVKTGKTGWFVLKELQHYRQKVFDNNNSFYSEPVIYYETTV